MRRAVRDGRHWRKASQQMANERLLVPRANHVLSLATGHGFPAGLTAARLPSVATLFSSDARPALRVAWQFVQLESYELSPCFRSTWGSWQAVQASRASLES